MLESWNHFVPQRRERKEGWNEVNDWNFYLSESSPRSHVRFHQPKLFLNVRRAAAAYVMAAATFKKDGG